jgi:hypothetical protein
VTKKIFPLAWLFILTMNIYVRSWFFSFYECAEFFFSENRNIHKMYTIFLLTILWPLHCDGTFLNCTWVFGITCSLITNNFILIEIEVSCICSTFVVQLELGDVAGP